MTFASRRTVHSSSLALSPKITLMKSMLFAVALLTLASPAQAVGFTELEDFGDTYETATPVPLGTDISGGITPDDFDYLLFNLPGDSRWFDTFRVDFSIDRAPSPERTRVLVYIGDHNIVGSGDFFDSGTRTFQGNILFDDPTTMIVRIGKLSAIGTDATYNVRLTTSIPEPTTCILSVLAFGAVLGLGRRRSRPPA
jgi:hypothetical protein